jgi:hypothetical protein
MRQKRSVCLVVVESCRVTRPASSETHVYYYPAQKAALEATKRYQ